MVIYDNKEYKIKENKIGPRIKLNHNIFICHTNYFKKEQTISEASLKSEWTDNASSSSTERKSADSEVGVG